MSERSVKTKLLQWQCTAGTTAPGQSGPNTEFLTLPFPLPRRTMDWLELATHSRPGIGFTVRLLASIEFPVSRPLIWIDPVKLALFSSKSLRSVCWIQGAAGMICDGGSL